MFEYYQIFLMLAGFLMALYSCMGNDVIQTLGTFMSSNVCRKRWIIWAFTGTILTATMTYGFISGDMAFGRLDLIPQAVILHWWHLIPPIVLILLTWKGIPVSTTFLLLSVFAGSAVIEQMVVRSFLGYIIAFFMALIAYSLIAKKIESLFVDRVCGMMPLHWVILQLCSTSFLWSQWIMQNASNMMVFLPRESFVWKFLLTLIAMLVALGLVVSKNGGEIQKIILRKTNTTDLRSATIIDFMYGIILFLFLRYNNIPVSTTFVFIGLLAGREIAMHYRLGVSTRMKMWKDVWTDLGKVCFGLIVSFIIVLLLAYF